LGNSDKILSFNVFLFQSLLYIYIYIIYLHTVWLKIYSILTRQISY
jgi:hypothetical protein